MMLCFSPGVRWIAMGAAGSDVALETADVVLMADRLEKLEQAIRRSSLSSHC